MEKDNVKITSIYPNNIQNTSSLTKNVMTGTIKGATRGIGVSGTVNTLFPSLIPTVSSYLMGKTNVNFVEGLMISIGLSSKPMIEISGLGMLAIGAGIGAIIGGSYNLVKGSIQNHQEKKKVKELKKN